MTDALLLLGPTGSGKSALALELARHYPSRSSASTRRRSTAGSTSARQSRPSRSARPSPHHLIDIRDPAQRYSAAEFVRDAQAAIAEVRARGKLPLLVGGTMLYAKALRDGLSNLPSADPSIRARAREQDARQLGWPALHARLAALDPRHRRAAGAERRAAHPARARSDRSDRQADVGTARASGAPPAAARLVALMPGRSRRAAPAHRTALRRDAETQDLSRRSPGSGNAAI